MTNNKKLLNQTCKSATAAGCLYINQREMAVVHPKDKYIHTLGSDDATTCHLVILRHRGSGVTGLVHFDGCDSESALNRMVTKIIDLSQKESHDTQHNRIILHIVGGFTDARNESLKLTAEITGLCARHKAEFSLETFCVLGANTTHNNGVPFPIVYGLAVDVATGDVFRASFSHHGPDIAIRSASHFADVHDMMDVYDHESGLFVLGPYDWKSQDWVTQFTQKHVPDYVIRKYLSTSPEQEPVHFEEHVRHCLKVLGDHPEPLKTLFPGSRPRFYRIQHDGTWTREHLDQAQAGASP